MIPDRVQPLPPPVFVDGEPEFEITEVLDSKIDHWHSKCKLLYLVHWTGSAGMDEEMSWPWNSEMHPSLSRISISRTWPSRAPSDNFNAMRPRFSPTLVGMINYLRQLRFHTFLINQSIIL